MTRCPGCDRPVPRIAVVTPAQRAVVVELARDGAPNHVIARRLGIDIETVKTHLRRAMAASGCTSRTALVAALLHGEVRLRTVGQAPKRARHSEEEAS